MTDPTGSRSSSHAWVKDPELEDLFASLESAPPRAHDPLLATVTARIAQRRRRRRAATGLVTTAALLITGVVAARILGGARDDGSATADNPGLTISYGDEVYTFTSFTEVACSTGDSGHPTLQAQFRPAGALKGTQLVAPILSIDARPDLVAAHGPTFDLPEAAGDSENNAFTLFTAVPVTPGTDNEASSQEKGATGTVTITELTCGTHPTFTLTADAELGSEVGRRTIPISGTITYPSEP